MDNRGKLHEWNNKRMSVDRYISMFDTVLASTLTECQDDQTHDLSLALNDQVQVSGVVSGANTNKGKAEVTCYDIAKRWNIGLETDKSLRKPRGTKDLPKFFAVSIVWYK